VKRCTDASLLDCNNHCDLSLGAANTMGQPSRTVLIVDDSAAIRSELSEEFTRCGFAVCGEAENGRQAIDKVGLCRPDLVILDLSMPVMNGLDAAPELRKIAPEMPIILYTAFADAVSASDLKARGVTLTLPKSEPLETLIAKAKELLQT